MPSLTSKDRVSLCLFSFTDGRRCRTPAPATILTSVSTTPKRRPRPAPPKSLAKDLATFFSGDYLSASDLRTALPRLIPAVIRGDKTQTRPHRCLHVPNSIAGHPHRPTRIHQRLRHRRLAQSRPHLRQRQL
jgi:hypothetical protein